MNLFFTAHTAGILGIVFVMLSFRVISLRRREQVALGSGGYPALERSIRAHANFSEYTPMALLLLLIGELQAVEPFALTICAVTLVLGRIIHAIGISRVDENLMFRVTGMILTFVSILGSIMSVLLSAAANCGCV